MQLFEHKIEIDANTKEESKEILLSMIDIMKTVRRETSTAEFIRFAAKIKAKPKLVGKAQKFL